MGLAKGFKQAKQGQLMFSNILMGGGAVVTKMEARRPAEG